MAGIVAVLCIAAALRIPDLNRDQRFQPDEALYATFGRQIALSGDPLLTGVALDKPPLLFYGIGAAFRLFGEREFSARVPSLFASLISIAGVFALTRHLYNMQVGLCAALLLAICPLDRLLSVGVYTDSLMTMGIVLACMAAVYGRFGIAGLLIGGALAVKPSAAQWIPLVVGLGVIAGYRSLQLRLRSFAITFVVSLIILTLWSVARDTTPDFWTLNAANNNPGRFIRAAEVVPRFARWGVVLSAIFPVAVIGWLAPALSFRTARTSDASRRLHADLLLTAYTLGTLSAYWLIAFNTYDRYLLPVTPFLLMLIARVLCGLFGMRRAGVIGILAVGLWTPSLPVTPSYQGIDRIAAELNTLPVGTRVYEHWLGWELRYYLGASPAVDLVWLPSVAELTSPPAPLSASSEGESFGLFGGRGVYLVAPREAVRPWLEELARVDVGACARFDHDSFVILRIWELSETEKRITKRYDNQERIPACSDG